MNQILLLLGKRYGHVVAIYKEGGHAFRLSPFDGFHFQSRTLFDLLSYNHGLFIDIELGIFDIGL